MWSFGICLYKMTVAYFPTDIKKYQYGSGPIPFREKDWNTVNFNEMRSLIEACLEINPEKRITAKEALRHKWFDSL
jgi:serine/threonine protein kinase